MESLSDNLGCTYRYYLVSDGCRTHQGHYRQEGTTASQQCYRLVKTSLSQTAQQSQQRFANAQLADIEEEELEVDSLTADAKPVKALGTYPYPLANNHLRKTPP